MDYDVTTLVVNLCTAASWT